MQVCNSIVYSYIAATENGSGILKEVTNPLNACTSPSKQVSFHHLTDSSIPLEGISESDNDEKTRSTKESRKTSVVSLSELKLIHYKLAVAFGICFIFMLFLLPIILYYVEGTGEISNDFSPIREIGTVNTSQVYQNFASYN